MSRLLLKMITGFCTRSAGNTPQFINYYLLKFQYSPDGYYQTYEHRKAFKQQIKQLEDKLQARILGGDNFPKNSTTLLFNCNTKQIPTKFAENCVYYKKKCVKNIELVELNLISSQKFEKIWQFYQPQVE